MTNLGVVHKYSVLIRILCEQDTILCKQDNFFRGLRGSLVSVLIIVMYIYMVIKSLLLIVEKVLFALPYFLLRVVAILALGIGLHW